MKVSLDVPDMLVLGTALFCFISRVVADETVEKRIFNLKDNNNKERKDRPFFVQLEISVTPDSDFGNPIRCGGVFIELNIVLSAARCFIYTHPKELAMVTARVGYFRLQKKQERRLIEALSVEVIRNNLGDKPSHLPDIARVTLESEADGSTDILKICGDDFWKTSIIGMQLVTVGAGRNSRPSTKDPFDPKLYPTVLARMNISVNELYKVCQYAKEVDKIIDSKYTFCATALETKIGTGKEISFEDMGTCEGDEGGPVFRTTEKDDAECLVGVLNTKHWPYCDECREAFCENGIFFTSVQNYQYWVDNNKLEQIYHKSTTPTTTTTTTKKPSTFSRLVKKPFSRKTNSAGGVDTTTD